MSKWISGKEIIAEKKIHPLELWVDYVHHGLQPYRAGSPVTPYDLMKVICDEELSREDKGVTPYTPSEGYRDGDAPRTFYVRNSLETEIRISHKLKNLAEVAWQDFMLTEVLNIDDTEAFLSILGSCTFLKAEYSNLQKNAAVGIVGVGEAPKKLRPDQKDKLEFQAKAKELWALDPTITIKEMSEKLPSKDYLGKRTVYNWIKEVAPNRKPGRRPAPKKK